MPIQNHNVALIPLTKKVAFSEVTRTAAALQRQINTDFGPCWDCSATISAFEGPHEAPPDYWRVHIVDPEPGTGLGRHWYNGNFHDETGQPFANVCFGKTWSLTASHELLEMLADPWGSRLASGVSPEGDGRAVGFLVEVCDPVQDPQCGYLVNGCLVSDFCTPQYFGFSPCSLSGFSFKNRISAAADVAVGGTLAWCDIGSSRWSQKINRGGTPEVSDLGFIDLSTLSLRTEINQRSPSYSHLSDALFSTDLEQLATVQLQWMNNAMAARADRLDKHMQSLAKRVDAMSEKDGRTARRDKAKGKILAPSTLRKARKRNR